MGEHPWNVPGSFVLDMTTAEIELGYRPLATSSTAVRSTIDWLVKTQPAAAEDSTNSCATRPRTPVVLLADGGDHSYWHDRRDGAWGASVLREAIPAALRRTQADAHRVAIGGISMGGFGALDLARLGPRRFCAVGAHSAALGLGAANGGRSVRRRRDMCPRHPRRRARARRIFERRARSAHLGAALLARQRSRSTRTARRRTGSGAAARRRTARHALGNLVLELLEPAQHGAAGRGRTRPSRRAPCAAPRAASPTPCPYRGG